jgi:hypothetical protein
MIGLTRISLVPLPPHRYRSRSKRRLLEHHCDDRRLNLLSDPIAQHGFLPGDCALSPPFSYSTLNR